MVESMHSLYEFLCADREMCVYKCNEASGHPVIPTAKKAPNTKQHCVVEGQCCGDWMHFWGGRSFHRKATAFLLNNNLQKILTPVGFYSILT